MVLYGKEKNIILWHIKFLNLMSEILQKYATAKGILGVTDEYAWKLTWGGLQNTTTFYNHWNNFPNLPVINSYNLTTNDSTRGLKYALTPQRCNEILNNYISEVYANNVALGRKRSATNPCY